MMAEFKECVICPFTRGNKENTNDGTFFITKKGCQSIAVAARMRNVDISVEPGMEIHIKCRKFFCDPRKIETVNDNPSVDLRSSEEFPFHTNCLFCEQPAKLHCRKRGIDVHEITSKTFQETLMKIIERRSDEWSSSVHERIRNVQDLQACGAVYHHQCSVNFRTAKSIPTLCNLSKNDRTPRKIQKKRSNGGRFIPSSEEALTHITNFLSSNRDQFFSTKSLIDRMEEHLRSLTADTESHPISPKIMKKWLVDHFGSEILVIECAGQSDIVTLQSKGNNLVSEIARRCKNLKHSGSRTLESCSDIQILSTAANIIRKEIMAFKQATDEFPDLPKLDDCMDYLPKSLSLFLRELCTDSTIDLKKAAVGQSLMQITRPRVFIPPILFGLGVQLQHQFSSRFLIDTLHSLGFSISYSEVLNFQASAALANKEIVSATNSNQFLQFVADNVDHQSMTIDGHGTFHGMGLISSLTPGNDIAKRKRVPRLSKVCSDELDQLKGIKVHIWEEKIKMTQCQFHTSDLPSKLPQSDFDLLWKFSWPCRPSRPSWSGFMQMVSDGNGPSKSSLQFLPMLDLNPSSMTCVYSTLCFIADQARTHHVTPVVTFDQPLWWKANMIIESSDDMKDFVLRLGVFHAQMSFLGTIGYLMGGTGLEEALEQVYAGHTVGHIMSGKAVSRAMRAHSLVETALASLLIEPGDILSGDPALTSDTEQNRCDPLLEQVGNLYDCMISTVTDLGNDAMQLQLAELMHQVEQRRNELKENRTAQLWFMYLDMLEILHQLVRAERTGNWALHLESCGAMVPYLAASGHNHYTKSIVIYLNKMKLLEIEHPDVFQHFQRGCHVIKRTENQWAGISTDLTIEQTLMRCVKTRGGLTRGRGIDDRQRKIWIHARPECTAVDMDFQDLCGLKRESSDQHKDLRPSRVNRDNSDTIKICDFFSKRNPFTNESKTLRSIITGTAAHSKVNVDEAYAIGGKILRNMDGVKVAEYSFKKSNQVVTLASKISKSKNETTAQISIKPEVLFQRYVLASHYIEESSTMFSYELCSYPASLFERPGVMRKAIKVNLADAIAKTIEAADINYSSANIESNVSYVLDGGSLLHRVSWNVGETYEVIASKYVSLVQSSYSGSSIHVVFDGYTSGPSSKDHAHTQRLNGAICSDVEFGASSSCHVKKATFLSNSKNKQKMINLIADRLRSNDISVLNAESDADLLIVQTALAIANSGQQEVVVIGEDTDLLVLLTYYVKDERITFRSDIRTRTSPKTRLSWAIQNVKAALGTVLCKGLLFCHAFLGCDTTSSLFGIGKGTILKKITNHNELKRAAEVFNSSTSTKDQVFEAGEQAIKILYGGKTSDSLSELRCHKFSKSAAVTKNVINPASLPPTSNSAKFHSYRVYHQVQSWLNHSLQPTDWGWQLCNDKLSPIQSDAKIAPDELLDVVKCSCKSGCSTSRCTCRRHGLECTSACAECKGTSCCNSFHPEIDTDSDEGDLQDLPQTTLARSIPL